MSPAAGAAGEVRRCRWSDPHGGRRPQRRVHRVHRPVPDRSRLTPRGHSRPRPGSCRSKAPPMPSAAGCDRPSLGEASRPWRSAAGARPGRCSPAGRAGPAVGDHRVPGGRAGRARRRPGAQRRDARRAAGGQAQPQADAGHGQGPRRRLPALRRRAARRLDVVHLGIGDDGHTASWPPGDPVVESSAPVAICGLFKGRIRMTLTPAVVNGRAGGSSRCPVRQGTGRRALDGG